MSWQITIYTREGCCLCDDMKEVVRRVAGEAPLEMNEVDVGAASDLIEKYGHEVPVLFINGRKAFKYRVTVGELKKKLNHGA